MNPFLAFRTLQIPAYQTLSVAVAGSFFFCKSATGIFQISFDGNEKLDMEGGFSISDNPFTSIQFINPTAAALTVKYFAGSSQVSYSAPLNLITVQTKQAPTYIKGTGETVLAAGASISFPGTDAGKDRKQFTVQNLDGAIELKLLDQNDTILARVAASEIPWTMELSGLIKLKNDSAQPVQYIVTETFYA